MVSRAHLLQQPAFLYDIGNGFLLYALSLVDVLQRIQLLRPFVLNHSNLSHIAFVKHSDVTREPYAPFQTLPSQRPCANRNGIG